MPRKNAIAKKIKGGDEVPEKIVKLTNKENELQLDGPTLVPELTFNVSANQTASIIQDTTATITSRRSLRLRKNAEKNTSTVLQSSNVLPNQQADETGDEDLQEIIEASKYVRVVVDRLALTDPEAEQDNADMSVLECSRDEEIAERIRQRLESSSDEDLDINKGGDLETVEVDKDKLFDSLFIPKDAAEQEITDNKEDSIKEDVPMEDAGENPLEKTLDDVDEEQAVIETANEDHESEKAPPVSDCGTTNITREVEKPDTEIGMGLTDRFNRLRQDHFKVPPAKHHALRTTLLKASSSYPNASMSFLSSDASSMNSDITHGVMRALALTMENSANAANNFDSSSRKQSLSGFGATYTVEGSTCSDQTPVDAPLEEHMTSDTNIDAILAKRGKSVGTSMTEPFPRMAKDLPIIVTAPSECSTEKTESICLTLHNNEDGDAVKGEHRKSDVNTDVNSVICEEENALDSDRFVLRSTAIQSEETGDVLSLIKDKNMELSAILAKKDKTVNDEIKDVAEEKADKTPAENGDKVEENVENPDGNVEENVKNPDENVEENISEHIPKLVSTSVNTGPSLLKPPITVEEEGSAIESEVEEEEKTLTEAPEPIEGKSSVTEEGAVKKGIAEEEEAPAEEQKQSPPPEGVGAHEGEEEDELFEESFHLAEAVAASKLNSQVIEKSQAVPERTYNGTRASMSAYDCRVDLLADLPDDFNILDHIPESLHSVPNDLPPPPPSMLQNQSTSNDAIENAIPQTPVLLIPDRTPRSARAEYPTNEKFVLKRRIRDARGTSPIPGVPTKRPRRTLFQGDEDADLLGVRLTDNANDGNPGPSSASAHTDNPPSFTIDTSLLPSFEPQLVHQFDESQCKKDADKLLKSCINNVLGRCGTPGDRKMVKTALREMVDKHLEDIKSLMIGRLKCNILKDLADNESGPDRANRARLANARSYLEPLIDSVMGNESDFMLLLGFNPLDIDTPLPAEAIRLQNIKAARKQEAKDRAGP